MNSRDSPDTRESAVGSVSGPHEMTTHNLIDMDSSPPNVHFEDAQVVTDHSEFASHPPRRSATATTTTAQMPTPAPTATLTKTVAAEADEGNVDDDAERQAFISHHQPHHQQIQVSGRGSISRSRTSVEGLHFPNSFASMGTLNRIANGSVTAIVKLLVKKSSFPMFETWLLSAGDALAKFPGFVSRSLIVPPETEFQNAAENHVFTFVHIIKWDNFDASETWINSDERAEWLQIAFRFGILENYDTLSHGMDIDFQDSDIAVIGPDMLRPRANSTSFASDAAAASSGKRPLPGSSSTSTVLKKTGASLPLAAKGLPQPAQKWKLCFVLYFSMYLNFSAHNFIGTTTAMNSVFNDPSFTLLVYVMLVIPFSTFGSSAVLLKIFRWFIFAPRSARRSVVREIFDDGFQMFLPPPPPPQPLALKRRLQTLEKRLDRLKRITLGSLDHISQVRSRLETMTSAKSELARLTTEDLTRRVQELRKTSQKIVDDSRKLDRTVTVAARHHVRWEFTEDFYELIREMTDFMKKKPGFVGLDIVQPKESSSDIPELDVADEDEFVDDHEVLVVIYRFDSYDHLEQWLQSDERLEIVRKLEPLLAKRPVFHVEQQNVVHDAFSSLFADYGNATAGSRPPPIWKTLVLSIISGFFAIWPISLRFTPALISWGVTNSLVVSLIALVLFTFCFVYIVTPFFSMLFYHWLQIPRPIPTSQPWKALDTGFASIWTNVAVMCVYYGATITLAVLVQLDVIQNR
eukprot:ANDGO_04485.mRNA.1 hypothetical protein